MKILLIYPGHSHSTIDVAKGYDEALRRLGHNVCAFNYHLSLGFYIGALDHWEEINPEFERRTGDYLVLASESLIVEAVEFVPDVVLIICGMALHRRAYALLDRLCLPKVVVLTESPYADAEQGKIIVQGNIAHALANDKASVEPLRELTGKPIDYLPHSFSDAAHYPKYKKTLPDEYKSDVYFFGTIWPERQRLFQPLLDKRDEYNLKVGGILPRMVKFVDGPDVKIPLVDNHVLTRNYSGTKIALNHHRTAVGQNGDGEEMHIDDGSAWSLGPRAYEISACGAFQLCDDTRPELFEVFGNTVATYRDGDDLVEKVDYYLDHPQERNEMARDARALVQTCSFTNRARDFLVPTLMEVTNGCS